MADYGFVADRATQKITFEMAPVRNQLTSLCLLGQDMDYISPWVDQTVKRLSKKKRTVVERICGLAMLVREFQPKSFKEFMQQIEDVEPDRLVHMQVDNFRHWYAHIVDSRSVPPTEELIGNVDKCVEMEREIHGALERTFDEKQTRTDWETKMSGGVYRDETIAVVRELYEAYLAPEWENIEPALEDTVAAFRSVDYSRGSLEEKLQRVADRDMIPASWLRMLAPARKIVVIPSIHIGPYMLLLDVTATEAWIVVPAHAPEEATVSTARLDRSELMMRLEALSDETRLKILEMAKAREEITTQLVMDELGLSQSSASRHLLQLTATGLLSVDASERTKRYRLNRKRVSRVSDELRRLFG